MSEIIFNWIQFNLTVFFSVKFSDMNVRRRSNCKMNSPWNLLTAIQFNARLKWSERVEQKQGIMSIVNDELMALHIRWFHLYSIFKSSTKMWMMMMMMMTKTRRTKPNNESKCTSSSEMTLCICFVTHNEFEWARRLSGLWSTLETLLLTVFSSFF